MFKDRDTRIGTLKIRGAGEKEDRYALFRRLSFLLNTVDFSPPGIPPSGILIVRRMQDPLPGKITPHGYHGYALRVETAWEKAAHGALHEKYRIASRPVKGRISPDSDAVFFEDESQLIAALALDIADGTAVNRWWWNVLLKKNTYASTLAELLRQQISIFPAVSAHLAVWNRDRTVIDKLSQHDVVTLLTDLVREFRIETAGAVILRTGKDHFTAGDESPSFPAASKKRDRPIKTFETLNVETAPPPAPWFHPFPGSSYSAPLHAALQGLALSIFFEPSRVHTQEFLNRLRRWWAYINSREAKQEPPRFAPKSVETLSPGRAPSASAQPAEPASPAVETFNQSPPPSPEPGAASHETPSPLNAGALSLSPEKGEKQKEKGKIGDRIRFNIPTRETPASAPTAPASAAVQAEEKIPAAPAAHEEREEKTPLSFSEEGVETRIAGVFYLVSLMEQLDLPACFEEMCQLESRVGAWGTLELLARALLDDYFPELQSDPLWDALARLDNREPGTLPGEDFYFTGEYTFPKNWEGKMAEFGSRANTRFARNVETASRVNPGLPETFNHINRWLCFVLPYIRHYFLQLLKPAEHEDADIIKTVLFTDARLYVTAAHVDIVMGLDRISLPVRMAGLDRDPGWQPQFGRVILFHFN